jgi:DNA-binding GntR family transcriptional regulator
MNRMTDKSVPKKAPHKRLRTASPRLRKGERHETIIAQLRHMIISGEIPAGSRIREQPLTEQLGVSRTPIREALRSLAMEGFIELLPNRGARVAIIDANEVEQIIDVIATLEGRAAVLACKNASDQQIAKVEMLQKKMRSQFERGDFSGYFETNQLIHQAIVEGSGNVTLLWTWNLLAARAARAKSLSHQHGWRWQSAMAEHEAMLTALKDRNGKVLANILVKHHRTGVRLVRELEGAQNPWAFQTR